MRFRDVFSAKIIMVPSDTIAIMSHFSEKHRAELPLAAETAPICRHYMSAPLIQAAKFEYFCIVASFFLILHPVMTTSIEAVRNSIKNELDALNERIGKTLDSSNPLMNQVIGSYLSHKGKQLRPMFVILTARLFGASGSEVIAAAAAVELLHNASLIHDDVVDNSGTRHGNPTINMVWDNHIAVLVGDFFVSAALHQAVETANIRIVETLGRLGKLLSLGEMDQIYNARYHKLDEEAYFKIISHKTASLFVSCVEMGCYAAGITDGRLEKMRRFAELFGLCFQIKDDIFDYFDDDAIGKPTGNDLREGKITLPLLYALSREEHPRHKEMLELSRREQLNQEEIASLIAFAKEAAGIDYAYATMQRLRDEAAGIIAEFPQGSETRGLLGIFDSVIARRQ